MQNKFNNLQSYVFPIGIPDIDREILQLVDDLTLIRICSINHYLRELHPDSFWEKRSKDNYNCDLDKYLYIDENYQSVYPLIIASFGKNNNNKIQLINEIIIRGFVPLFNNLPINFISDPVSAFIIAGENNRVEILISIISKYDKKIVTRTRNRLDVNKKALNALQKMSTDALIEFSKVFTINNPSREKDKLLKSIFTESINYTNIEVTKNLLPYISSRKVLSSFNNNFFPKCLKNYDNISLKEQNLLIEILYYDKEIFSDVADIFSPSLINDLLLRKLPLVNPISEETIDYYKIIITEMIKMSWNLINETTFLQLRPLRQYLRNFIGELITKHYVDEFLIEKLIKHKFLYK